MTLIFQIDNEQKRINLPFSVEEISYSAFCDFRQLESEYWDLNKSEQVDSSEAANKLLDALKTLVQGDIDELPFAHKDEDWQTLIDTAYLVSLGDELSIMRVYAHLVNLIAEYKPESIPETFVWAWMKNKYIIKSGPAARILENKPLGTGEAIECMEYQRRAAKAKEANPSNAGNIDFELGLTEMAILLRKPGERLPSNRKKLDQFINSRRRLFSNMPLSEVLNVRFFLLSALIKLHKTKTTNSSGTDLRAVIDSKSPKPKGSVKNWLKWRGVSTVGVYSTK